MRAEKSTLDAVYLEWLLATLAATLVARGAADAAHRSDRAAYLRDEGIPTIKRFQSAGAAMIPHAPVDVVVAAEAFGGALGQVNIDRARTPAELAAAEELNEIG